MQHRTEDEQKKKKTIAFKAASDSKRDDEESEEESTSSNDDLEDEDIAMVVRRFRKFMGRKKGRYNQKFHRKDYGKEKEKDREKDKEVVPTCYECKKPGHIRPDCPLLKKSFRQKKKKKAMVATWSDSEDSSSSEEEETTKTANLCLMGLEDEVTSPSNCTEFTFDELNSAFHDLLSEFKKAGVKIKSLKNMNDSLLKQKDEISEKNTLL